MTDEEVRSRNMAAMGEELGELFSTLDGELTWVFLRWMQFRKLYVGPDADINLLNRTAPFFFTLIQHVLFEDTILGISRLSGPERSAGRPNLSIRRLVSIVSDPHLRDRVQTRVDHAVSVSAFAADWRNRYIAHRDLDLSLGRGAAPLAPAEITSVDAALDAIALVMNTITAHFFRSETGYRFSAPIQDAEDLMFYLKAGVRREANRQLRLERGEYDPADWDDSPIQAP